MATSPTMDPSVAAAIIPALEAGKQMTDQCSDTQCLVCGVVGILCSVRTGDNLQVNGAAVGARRVDGSADVFP